MSERMRKSECPFCGKFFHPLGLLNHRARCREKMNKKEMKENPKFNPNSKRMKREIKELEQLYEKAEELKVDG